VPAALKALAAGKHVLCEKPIGVAVEEVEELEAAVRKSGRILQVGHMLRFDPGIESARDFISNRMGQMLALKAWYCDSTHRYSMTDAVQPLPRKGKKVLRPAGDPKSDKPRYFMLAHGSHLVDLARFLGGPIRAVQARLNQRFGAHCWFIDVDFESGALGHLDLTIGVRMDWHEGFQVYGEHGSASAKIYNPWFFKSSDVELFHEDSATTTRVLGADAHFYRRQLEGFADSVLLRRTHAWRRHCRWCRLDQDPGGDRAIGRVRKECRGRQRDRSAVMQLGVFSRTYLPIGIDRIFARIAQDGFQAIQFNFSSAGLPSLPADWPGSGDQRSDGQCGTARSHDLRVVRDLQHGASRCRKAAGGPDRLRQRGASRASDEGASRDPVHGSRDATHMWSHHRDNESPEAWSAMRAELDFALELAERNGVSLGIEPEPGNVVASARIARRLLDEIRSPRLKIVMDAANLLPPENHARQREVVAEALALLGAELALVHTKDVGPGGEAVAAGRGIVDFRNFLTGILSTGYCGPLVSHNFPEGDAAYVAGFLRRVLAEVTS
jgi:predicted dehydrogenase/sugar phosphate isomerase/epimerase